MKLARPLLIFSVALSSLVSSPVAFADLKVADCAEFRNPTSTATATTITLSVDVYAKCTEEQLGRGKGQKPVYQMQDEESLFNLSSCSGPAINPLIGNGRLGTATCSLRVGTNTLPSPRTGATSTTIKMWFSWDFSSKTVSVSHKAIPAPTNNGWGGTPSGSTSGGSNSPVTKNCTNSPDVPNLFITWNERGPLFKFSPATSGEKTTVLVWSYALYDSVKSTWDAWSPWKEIYPASSGEYQAISEVNKSKIAFAVYGTNACGSSAQAREVATKTGVALSPVIQDQISYSLSEAVRVEVGDELDVYGIASSRLSLSLSVKSYSERICEASDAGIVRFIALGECSLEFTSTTYQNKLGASPARFSIAVKPQRIAQTIPELTLSNKYDLRKSPVPLNLLTDAGLTVRFTALTDDVCFVAGDSLILRNRGNCELEAVQEGNEDTLAATSRNFNIQVVGNKTTVVCTKGKLIKKVTDYNPKCPVGYRLKK